MNKYLKTVCLSTNIFLTACTHNIGPKYLPDNFNAYNHALLKSNYDQLLSNLVRLQFGVIPSFIQVGSMTTKISASVDINSLSGTANIAPGVSPIANYSITGGLPTYNYSTTPTISYTPIQGSAFTKRLIQPLKLEDVHHLIRSGWPVYQILKITLQKIGPLLNARAAANNPDINIPHYKRFNELVELLQKLYNSGYLKIYYTHYQKADALKLIFTPSTTAQPDVQKVYELLNIEDKGQSLYLVNSDVEFASNQIIPVTTHSFLGTLYYLSKGVEVPEKFRQSGEVYVTHYKNGKAFDWSSLLGNVIHIEYSKDKPEKALVSIYYEGYWYYIRNNDAITKETFAILNQLYNIAAGEIQSQTPILTISP